MNPVKFLAFHRMLAYRAEDISERLEPQELYDRQEFEESIQFDVSPTENPSTYQHPSLSGRLLKSVFSSGSRSM